MKKLSKIVCLLMALVLMIVMTACGSKKESTEEPVTDAQTEEQASTDEASDDYDIAANLKLMGDPEGVKIVDTDHFTLTLPLGGTWHFLQYCRKRSRLRWKVVLTSCIRTR